MKKFVVTIHYEEDDVDFMGDYCEISITDNEGKTVATWGSHYDDGSLDRLEGFKAALEYLGIQATFEIVSVADYTG